MRKRNVHMQFWLSESEADAFSKLVKRSGLSREAYLRFLITGLVPNDAPPPDYFSLMKELHHIGNNLNQLALKAHTLHEINVNRYDENVRLLTETIQKITEAVILPRKAELWRPHPSGK